MEIENWRLKARPTDAELAWLAGALEAHGDCGEEDGVARVWLNAGRPALFLEVQRLVGGDSDNVDGRWVWEIRGQGAIWLLRYLHPFLHITRARVEGLLRGQPDPLSREYLDTLKRVDAFRGAGLRNEDLPLGEVVVDREEDLP